MDSSNSSSSRGSRLAVDSPNASSENMDSDLDSSRPLNAAPASAPAPALVPAPAPALSPAPASPPAGTDMGTFPNASTGAQTSSSSSTVPLGFSSSVTIPIAAIVVALVLLTILKLFFLLRIWDRERTLRALRRAQDRARREAAAAQSAADAAPARLSADLVQTFPLLVYQAQADLAQECAVCLCENVSGEALRQLPMCGHVFHGDCIQSWLTAKTTCPICRVDQKARLAAPEEEEAGQAVMLMVDPEDDLASSPALAGRRVPMVRPEADDTSDAGGFGGAAAGRPSDATSVSPERRAAGRSGAASVPRAAREFGEAETAAGAGGAVGPRSEDSLEQAMGSGEGGLSSAPSGVGVAGGSRRAPQHRPSESGGGSFSVLVQGAESKRVG